MKSQAFIKYARDQIPFRQVRPELEDLDEGGVGGVVRLLCSQLQKNLQMAKPSDLFDFCVTENITTNILGKETVLHP